MFNVRHELTRNRPVDRVEHCAGNRFVSIRRMAWPALWLLMALSDIPAYGQRNLTAIPDPDPEIERKSFQVADGFEVNLFAADPMLAKPIQMNWDAAGRLWVASSEVYPQIEPGQKANDKILILEDTDGDGTADKTTVFADGLLIPTGVEPDRIGPAGSSAFVANSTELLHLVDTNGDGRADQTDIILSGFGTEDTHHILHTFRWGDDGALYFNQSIYIHSHIETPWGVRRLGGGGIWQFRPDSWQLEVLCRGFVNPWGHHVDDWGQSFATDGAYGEGINYVFPGAVFFSAPGATRIVRGLNPGSPKHCGLEIASGTHLPESWRGNMLTNDFRGNRVCRFVITEEGSGYVSREQPELIKTSHVAFRPIDIKMGPDGAIYIADWYNPIIQHGEVDFRDPRRDHTHGRIWRVTAKGRPLVRRPKLVGATTAELLESLKSPDQWTRHFAKRALKDLNPVEVAPQLAAWVRGLDPHDPQWEHHRLEALWAYQTLDIVQPELLESLLQAKDGRARAAAIRVLAQWAPRLEPASTAKTAPSIGPRAGPSATGSATAHGDESATFARRLAGRVADDHPRVRLEAVRSLAMVRTQAAAELAARVLDKPMDQFLDYALWLTVRELEPYWLPQAIKAHSSAEMGFGGNVRHQVFALQAINNSDVARPLVALLQEGGVPADLEESVLSSVGSLGGPNELAMVFELAVASDATRASRRTALLNALMQATKQRRQIRPEGKLEKLASFMIEGDDDALRTAAVRAAGLWRVEAVRPQLLRLARADGTAATIRQSAIDSLGQIGGPESQEALEALADRSSPLEIRMLAAGALGSIDLSRAGNVAATLLADCDRDANVTGLLRRFLEWKEGPKFLAAALADHTINSDVAKIGVRLAQTSGREQSELINALTKAGALNSGVITLSPDEMQQMVREVSERGDAKRGEDLFRRTENNCLKCHSIAGAGGQAGPDLISIGASAQIDYLIDSLLDPNKQVKEGFHSTVVATSDGLVLTGLKVRQTDSELVLRNAEDQEVAIPLNTIEEQKTGGSIMPAGLTDSLTTGELLDLVRFLSLLGKPDGPYAVSQARVARRWQILTVTQDLGEEIRHAGPDAAAKATDAGWNSAYSRVSGELPLEIFQPTKIAYLSSSLGFARCQIEVTTPGRIGLVLNSAEGLRLWVDGATREPREALELDLAAGRHTVLLAVDLMRRQQAIRCELIDAKDSQAKAEFVLR